MEPRDRIVLVAGVTGKQGGAVARRLLEDGWRVRGITRDPDKEEALAAAVSGAEVVRADLMDRDDLDRVMDGVYGVFGVEPATGTPETEEREGFNLIDAAERAGVGHFVQSSVGGADRRTNIPHWESKRHIEVHLRESTLPYTVWRPVSFMENFGFQRDSILDGVLHSWLPPEGRQQLIAVDDVARFVALGFREPGRFVRTNTEIAGDELTMAGVAEVFSRVFGRPIRLEPAAAPRNENEARMREWVLRSGYRADVPALRQILPGLRTLEDWARASGWTTETSRETVAARSR